jgi:hypothetical protein
MKTFLKALPLFFSFIILEFIVYVFIYFCFSTDFVALEFLRLYPWIIRIAVISGFFASFIASFFAPSNRYFFLAIWMNMIFLFLFFEYTLFHTLNEPLRTIFIFCSRTWNSIIRGFKSL